MKEVEVKTPPQDKPNDPSEKIGSPLMKKSYTFSRNQLLLFIAIFAAIGGYALYRSFAASGAAYTMTSSLSDNTTISGKLTWTVAVTPQPYEVDFYIDGVKDSHVELYAPYQYKGDPSGVLDTTLLSNGKHTFQEVAIYDNRGSTTLPAGYLQNGATRTSTHTLTVSNGSITVAPPPSSSTDKLLFDGTWPSSGPADMSIWSGPGTANNVVTVNGIRDPLGSLENVGFFKVARSNTLPCCAYAGRADYESPELMSPTKNNDVYISIPVYLPMSNVAAMYKNKNGWMVAEPYGPPYGGSPAAGGIDVSPISSSSIQYDFTWNDYGSWDAASCVWQNDGSSEKQWTSPLITTDSWHTFIMHIHWATDKTGFEELWYDGMPQQFHAAPRSGCTGAPPQPGTGGANTRLYFANYVAGNNDGAANFIDVNLYGNESTDGSIYTTYHGETKIGTSLSIVQPAVYPAGP